MLNIKDKLKFFFNDSKESKDIFSTSERTHNLGNTNPLDISDNGRDIILSDYKPIYFNINDSVDKIYSDDESYNVMAKRLSKSIIKSCFMGIFLFVLFLVSASMDVLYRFYPSFFNFSNIDKNYLYLYFQGTINIIFLVYTIVFMLKKLKLSRNYLLINSLGVCFAGLFSLLQCLSLLSSKAGLYFCVNTYVSIFSLCVVMMHFNDLLVKKRVKRNLKFVESKKEKFISGLYEKGGLDNSGHYRIAYRKQVEHVGDFFNASFMTTNLSKGILLLNLISLFIVAVVAVFCIINSRSIEYSFSALTITLLMLNPLPFLSAIDFHINRVCKKALKKGAMITSLYAGQCFFKTNALVVDASSLYPADNVVLRSIKTFKGQRIDEAILRAAAVICDIGGPLSKVFDKIIMGKKNMLLKPTEVMYEDKMGVIGYIDSQRVLLGNRELLKKYKVDPPSRDYEKKYIYQGMEHIYLAIGKDLVAMFILEYLPCKSLKKCLNKLEKNGILIFVKTADCNVTVEKISRDFNISESGVKVLKFKSREQIDKIENIKNDDLPGLICTYKRLSSFIWVLCLSKKMFFKKNLAMMIMILASILGCVFSVSLSLVGGIDVIKPVELVIYYLFWIFITLIIPGLGL